MPSIGLPPSLVCPLEKETQEQERWLDPLSEKSVLCCSSSFSQYDVASLWGKCATDQIAFHNNTVPL